MQLGVADLVFATEFRQGAAQGGLVSAVELVLPVKVIGVLVLEVVESGFRSVSAVPAGLKSGDACVFAGKVAIGQRHTAAVARSRGARGRGGLGCELPGLSWAPWLRAAV